MVKSKHVFVVVVKIEAGFGKRFSSKKMKILVGVLVVKREIRFALCFSGKR